MKLVAYTKFDWPISIQRSPIQRLWMDKTAKRFAYRCLPLTIANQHGWEITCPVGFSAGWNGRDTLDGIMIKYDDNPCPFEIATSHFGHGILTFSVAALFRTEPGWDLMVQGPINTPRDAIYPLTAVVETSWSPYTFTMNWKFTRPGIIIRFDKGDPFCHIFPIQHQYLEKVEPEYKKIEDEPELLEQHLKWGESRTEFNQGIHDNDPNIVSKGWQKNYFRGQDLDYKKATPDHITKLDLKEFKNEIKYEMNPNANVPGVVRYKPVNEGKKVTGKLDEHSIEQIAKQLNKSCGSCSLCCELMGITELEKPGRQVCKFQRVTGGCKIYPDRPHSCRNYACQWLISGEFDEEWYPLKSGLVLSRHDYMPSPEEIERGVDPANEPELYTVNVRDGYSWKVEPYYSKIKEIATMGYMYNKNYQPRREGEAPLWIVRIHEKGHTIQIEHDRITLHKDGKEITIDEKDYLKGF